MSGGVVKLPADEVSTTILSPVARLVTVTVACATAPPVLSATSPVIKPLSWPWTKSKPASAKRETPVKTHEKATERCFILRPPVLGSPWQNLWGKPHSPPDTLRDNSSGFLYRQLCTPLHKS